MKYLIILAVVCTVGVWSDHLIVGNVSNKVILGNHSMVTYNAIPFIKRVKYFFYTQQDNRLIQGIQALDTLHSKASINITAGGVGYSFVNLRLKSERGRGLAYDIALDTPQRDSAVSLNITARGAGYFFVNLRLKSERGGGLAYDIFIYIQDYAHH